MRYRGGKLLAMARMDFHGWDFASRVFRRSRLGVKAGADLAS